MLYHVRLFYRSFIILSALRSGSLVVTIILPSLIVSIHFLFSWGTWVRHGYVRGARLTILWNLIFAHVRCVSIWWCSSMHSILLLSYCLDTSLERVGWARCLERFLLLAPPLRVNSASLMVFSQLFLSPSHFSFKRFLWTISSPLSRRSGSSLRTNIFLEFLANFLGDIHLAILLDRLVSLKKVIHIWWELVLFKILIFQRILFFWFFCGF